MTDYTLFDDPELLSLADLDFQGDRHEAALSKLKILLSRGSAPLQTYALLGRIYATIGLLTKAKQAFGFYLDNESESERRVNETFQLGLVEKDMGNIEDAITIWDDLLNSMPEHSPTLYQKALALIGKGEKQAAVDLLNRVLETADDNDPYIPMADQMLSKLALQ